VPLWQVSRCVQGLPSLHAEPSGLAGFVHAPVTGSQTPASWHWSGAAHTTGFRPVQTPAWQLSPRVQALPSSQGVPFGRWGLEQTPVVGLQVPASWHWSVAAQTMGCVPTQAPARQVSLCVQALPSLQLVPSGFTGFEHVPVLGLQIPASWHWSEGAQVIELAPLQTPRLQVSPCVQALPSLHGVPAGWSGWVQVPVAGWQVPAPWQASIATQTTGLAPVHVPARHESVSVHASPSLHAVPSALGDASQRLAASLHTPLLHWSADVLQLRSAPPQTPLVQLSFTVQKRPSLQSAPLGLRGAEQAPVAGSQTPAVWQESMAGQVTRLAPLQIPARQVSICVQALPSSHTLPFGFWGFEQVPVSGSQVPGR